MVTLLGAPLRYNAISIQQLSYKFCLFHFTFHTSFHFVFVVYTMCMWGG